ncbi:hypothetical protein MKW94_026242 [Papaver nudicaule]|uniref:heme oxygenase (biliverdin-producing) n=1 Tax=Papaver nudicaule TaxID=74823 RepID=A0AA41VT30_PAPNU|nr:hypothetical protein [Papaver nudicaule]
MASATFAIPPKRADPEKQNKMHQIEEKEFVEEMRGVAMKLHTKDQAKEGEKEPQGQPWRKWEPSIEGYLQFLVDNKLVYDTLEDTIVNSSSLYGDFMNTGLERSEALAKDLKWYKERGHTISKPSALSVSYTRYLEELSMKDPQAFICHYYNFYFAHTAGGRMIGKKVAAKILDNKELEFYKWDGNLCQHLENVREKLNKVAKCWSREEKNHCLEETEKSFEFSFGLLELMLAH